MSLRPRYSLLTLLVLPALVAGGVKLWYGPHRVVMSDPVYFEYSYIRDWHGNKIIQGPMITRYSNNDGIYQRFDVSYYRQGQGIWICKCLVWPAKSSDSEHTLADSPLSQMERAELQSVIDLEKSRMPNPSQGFKLVEQHTPLVE